MANLFKANLGTLGPALGQLDRVGVTLKMWELIGRKDGVYAGLVYEALAFKTVEIPSDATDERIIADAKATLQREGTPFTYFDDNVVSIVRRDLELVRGKTLEVLTHDHGRYWTTYGGRGLQKGKGSDGNAAAYLVWVTKTKPSGRTISIANTDNRLYSSGGQLMAPCFFRYDKDCKFSLSGTCGRFTSDHVQVFFRAL